MFGAHIYMNRSYLVCFPKVPCLLQEHSAFCGVNVYDDDQRAATMLDLHSTTVHAITLAHPSVVTLDSTSSIYTCLMTFVETGILSAPVYDEASGEYLGFMDMMDVVRQLVDKFGEQHLQHHDALHAARQEAFFTTTHIKDIIDFKDRNPFVAVAADTTLASLLDLFTADSKYVRRVAVVDPAVAGRGQIVSIVSQFALISYISKHHSLISQPTTTVSAFYAADKAVVSLSGGQSVLAAFQLMRNTGVSGVAVVDDSDRLIGSMSIRDLKGLVTSQGLVLSRLLLPARSYINLISEMSLDERHPAVSVLLTDTLVTTIDKLVAAGVHRLFVVDPKFHPVGVVSLVDILRVLAK